MDILLRAGRDTECFVFEIVRKAKNRESFNYHVVKILRHADINDCYAIMIYTLGKPEMITQWTKMPEFHKLIKLFNSSLDKIESMNIYPVGRQDRCPDQGDTRTK